MQLDSSNVYIMHHGKAIRLDVVLDRVLSSKGISEQISETVAGQISCLAQDVGQLEGRVSALEAPVMIEVQLRGRVGK
jgi:hypothetical protein